MLGVQGSNEPDPVGFNPSVDRDTKTALIGHRLLGDNEGYGVIRVPPWYGNVGRRPRSSSSLRSESWGGFWSVLSSEAWLWWSSSASGLELSRKASSVMGAGASMLGFIHRHVFLYFFLHNNVRVALLRAFFSHRNITDATALHTCGRRTGLGISSNRGVSLLLVFLLSHPFLPMTVVETGQPP